MRLAILDHNEAADQAVMANVARYLLGGEQPPTCIAHIDRPDVGKVVAPPAPIVEVASPAAPLPMDPVAAFSAPSTAVAAAQLIAPAAITPPTPPVASAPALPPAPPVAAPAAPAAPPSPAAAGAPVVDKNGLPWDERIHTGTKTMNKDGTWRQKRETDPALVAQVEAELRAKLGLAAPTPPAPPAPATPPAPIAAASPFAAGTAAAVEAGQPAAPATFGELMLWVTPKMTAGKIDNTGLQEVISHYGPKSLPELITHPDVAKLVPLIHAHLAATLGA